MATAASLSPLVLRALSPLLLLLLLPMGSRAAVPGCPPACACEAAAGARLSARCSEPPRGTWDNVSELTVSGGSARAPDWNGTRLPNLRLLNLSRSGLETLGRTSLRVAPASLDTLDLSDNALRNASAEALSDLRRLRVLDLSRAARPDPHAAAALVAAVAGARLSGLAVLRLAGNGVRELPPGTLAALPALETLDLRWNALERLGNATLEEMSALPRLREVWLAGNAFVCDCRLAETAQWLKERGRERVKDAGDILCTVMVDAAPGAAGKPGGGATPGALVNTTAQLYKQTLRPCDGEAVASYVLLGIVVALIGVIFLFVLYLNRRGIKKWLTHIRDACRDQIEEYNYRYELDANPRIANVVPPLDP